MEFIIKEFLILGICILMVLLVLGLISVTAELFSDSFLFKKIKEYYDKRNTKKEKQNEKLKNFIENYGWAHPYGGYIPEIYREEYDLIMECKKHFDKSERKCYDLIEYIFPSPQMTNETFSFKVKRLHEYFYKRYDSLLIFYKTYPYEDEDGKFIIEMGYDELKEIIMHLEGILKELSKLSVNNVSVSNDIYEEIDDFKEEIKNYTTGTLKSSIHQKKKET